MIKGCLRSYLQLKVIEKCGCGSPKYPVPTPFKICNITLGKAKIAKLFLKINASVNKAKCVWSFLDSEGRKIINEAEKWCPQACRYCSIYRQARIDKKYMRIWTNFRMVSFKLFTTFTKPNLHVSLKKRDTNYALLNSFHFRPVFWDDLMSPQPITCKVQIEQKVIKMKQGIFLGRILCRWMFTTKQTLRLSSANDSNTE